MRTLVAITLLVFADQASADLWTCQTKSKVTTVANTITRSTVKQSFEATLNADGTYLIDNHVNSFLIPGYYYIQGKKLYLYPDNDAQYQAAFEVAPTLSSATIVSNYSILKLNKRLGLATRATIKGYVDMYLYFQNGAVVRSIVNAKGKCTRLQ